MDRHGEAESINRRVLRWRLEHYGDKEHPKIAHILFNMVGLFFFGWNGRQANTWGNGSSYQCVVPPTRRTPLQAGTGTPGACDGSYSLDLNARWTSVPRHNPGAGAVVQAELWYRDPLNTSNRTSSMSDAVEFTVCP